MTYSLWLRSLDCSME